MATAEECQYVYSFWIAYDKRDLKTLKSFGENNKHLKIPAICLLTAAQAALYDNDIEVLVSIPFPTRWLLEKVAAEPIYLRRLLEAIDFSNYYKDKDIPDYVWEKTTKETRKIFAEYKQGGTHSTTTHKKSKKLKSKQKKANIMTEEPSEAPKRKSKKLTNTKGEEWVLNPLTKRRVKVGSKRYEKLLEQKVIAK